MKEEKVSAQGEAFEQWLVNSHKTPMSAKNIHHDNCMLGAYQAGHADASASLTSPERLRELAERIAGTLMRKKDGPLMARLAERIAGTLMRKKDGPLMARQIYPDPRPEVVSVILSELESTFSTKGDK